MADNSFIDQQEKNLPPGNPPDDSRRPITDEIAFTWRNVFSPVFNGLLRPDDDTLLMRGRGRGLRIYRELERDGHCYSVLNKRKMALIARPWALTPKTSSRLDKKAADFVTAVLKAVQFKRICYDHLDAILMGYSVGENMWDISTGEVVITDVIARDQRRFVYDVDNRLRLLSFQSMLYGDPTPERKFNVHRFGSMDGNPYGLGMGTRLFWPVFFKRQSIQFWMTFLDKFGSPTGIGKYPVGASESSKRTLLAALNAISQEASIAVPDGMEVTLLEAARAGNAGYEMACRYLDDEMSKAVLGETMSTTSKGAGMGSNQASVHNEVRLEITEADGELLAGSLNASLIKWLVEYNYPGAGVPSISWDVSEPTDRFNTAQADSLVSKMGFKPSLEYVQETYGDGWEEAPQEMQSSGAPGEDPTSSTIAFAEASTQSTVLKDLFAPYLRDLQAARLARAADPSIQAWIATVRSAVDGAENLEDLRTKLANALPQTNQTDLARTMQMAFTCAQLAGRYDLLHGMGT